MREATPPPIHDAAASPEDARRVLLVTARYFPFIGGTETHTYEMARRLVALGHAVTVLTTDPGGTLPTEECIEGVRILRVRAWPANRDYYFAPALARVIAAGGWDVVHCQGYHTLVAPLAMLTAWSRRIPYLVSFHSGGYSTGLRNAARRGQALFLRPLLARARHLIAVSRFEAELFEQRLSFAAERIVVIPNGSDLPVEVQAIRDEAHPLILSIGRLEQYKGHHRVIAALPRVAEEFPGVRLRIVGSGPYEADLRRLAETAGVSDRVEIGAIAPGARQEMARTLAQASVVAILSDYESQGIAALEAIALGRPVVVLSGTALRELVERGLARGIAPASTTAEVAAAIVEQLRQPFLPVTSDLPTWDSGAAALAALYRAIPSRARRD